MIIDGYWWFIHAYTWFYVFACLLMVVHGYAWFYMVLKGFEWFLVSVKGSNQQWGILRISNVSNGDITAKN